MAPHPLNFTVPGADDDYDCTMVLILPAPDDDAEQLAAGGRRRRILRRRTAPRGEASPLAANVEPAAKHHTTQRQAGSRMHCSDKAHSRTMAEQEQTRSGSQPDRSIRLPACSVLLKRFSPKFRDWIARWTDAAGGTELEIRCRDEGEVAGYRHLLAFIHSIGKEVPADVDDLVELLLLAREHAVEPAVLACIQRLRPAIATMPVATCLALLTALETGASAHDQVQAEADELVAAARRQLLQYLGPLQDMLNSEPRRKLFGSVTYELLRDCIFADDNVNADTETTVLAAFAYWADMNIRLSQPGCKERIAAVCSLIRFPAIPAHILWNYHRTFEFMRVFDPDRALLFRAIASAADPVLVKEWQQQLADGASELKANCERWWLPRPRPLAACAAPAEFEFQPCRRDAGKTSCYTGPVSYWSGYWWRVLLEDEEDCLGVYVLPSVTSEGTRRGDADKRSQGLYCLEVKYSVWLRPADSTGDLQVISSKGRFAPTSGHAGGWGRKSINDSNGEPILWDKFWADGSRFMHCGAARVRLALELPSAR